MAERKLPKLETGVRFPSPALGGAACRRRSLVWLDRDEVPRGARSGTGPCSGHARHRGTGALQISRPSRINPTCNGVRRPSGTSSCSSRSARSADAFGGTMPSRRVTRCTCVSTGSASRPSAKLTARRRPSSARRRAARSGRRAASASGIAPSRDRSNAPSRSRTSRRIAWIRGAFVFGEAADCGSRRRRRARARRPRSSHVGNAARRSRERALGVQVARVLREHREHQLVERVGARAAARAARTASRAGRGSARSAGAGWPVGRACASLGGAVARGVAELRERGLEVQPDRCRSARCGAWR